MSGRRSADPDPAAGKVVYVRGAYRQAAETARMVLEQADHLGDGSRASMLTTRAYSPHVVNAYEAALRGCGGTAGSDRAR